MSVDYTEPEPTFLESDADCIATVNVWIDRDNPKVYSAYKPVIFDLDHVAPENHGADLESLYPRLPFQSLRSCFEQRDRREQVLARLAVAANQVRL